MKRCCSECEQTQPDGYLRDACYWCRSQVREVEVVQVAVEAPSKCKHKRWANDLDGRSMTCVDCLTKTIGRCEHYHLQNGPGDVVTCVDCLATSSRLAYKAMGKDALDAPTWTGYWHGVGPDGLA